VKQLVVISGKGGTGKTSIVASFAALADNAILADCDVDAADLHLVLEPTVLYREEFIGGSQAHINPERCTGCGTCAELCRFSAISDTSEVPEDTTGAEPGVYRVEPVACEGCGVCAWFCDDRAISMLPVTSGEWFLSSTRHGPMAHARLAVAAENSGKLVSLVRGEARRACQARSAELVIIDGAPGVGCPVIASVTGADLALVVTEPTLSAIHDLGRVLQLTQHFDIPTLVLVNKHDLNPELAEQAAELARQQGAEPVGHVRYDPAVTAAQVQRLAVVEYASDGAASDIRAAWQRVRDRLTDSESS
jgi:MinD superfamily P-loop ATPase